MESADTSSKRYVDAETAYRSSIEWDSGHTPNHHVQLSFLLAKLGRLPAAEDAARRAIELDPSLPGGYFALGDALGGQGRFDAAAEASRRWVALQPDNPQAQVRFGNHELRRGNVEVARRAFATAVEIRPESTVFRRALANALNRGGHFQEAIVEARQAVALDPADASNARLLDTLLSHQTKDRQARVLGALRWYRRSPGSPAVKRGRLVDHPSAP